jgi:hypothetical protein
MRLIVKYIFNWNFDEMANNTEDDINFFRYGGLENS